MNRLWRILIASALVWLIFICGYLCRDGLGDWLVEAHSGSVLEQLGLITAGVGRIFLTFVIVAAVGLACTALLLGTVGLLQELWYQIFTRRIIAILIRQRERRDEEIQRQLDGRVDAGDIGAPRESVSALRHARSESGEVEPPKRSVSGRLRALQKAADEQVAAEREHAGTVPADLTDQKFELTYDH